MRRPPADIRSGDPVESSATHSADVEPAREVVRLEAVAEQLAGTDVSADGFAAAYTSSLAKAAQGARRESPAKSATRSPATCSRRSAITRVKAPMFTKV